MLDLDLATSELATLAAELDRAQRQGEATWQLAHELASKANAVFYQLAFNRMKTPTTEGA